MRRTVAAMAAGLALTLAACGGGSDGGGWMDDTSGQPAGEMSKARAFCNDLESGYTAFQILRDFVKDGTYTAASAARATNDMVREECPEQLATNENLRGYLEAWGISPD